MNSPRFALLIVFAIALAGIHHSAQAAPGRLDVGGPAPALSGIDIAGSTLNLQDYQGKWVYLDFWATWCGPCMQDLPNVVELSKNLQHRQDFSVMSVSLDEAPALGNVQQTAKDYGIGYPVLFDGQGWRSHFAEAWGINSIPATFLVNPEGVIVARDIRASEVASLIGSTAAAAYQPMRVATSEEILPDSPSTGRSSLRDVKIALDFDPSSRDAKRFYLYVACGIRPPAGQPSKHDLRYEIAFTPTENQQAMLVDIKRATGVSYLSDVFAQLEAIDPGSMLPNDAPDISVEIDSSSRRCVFSVPLPKTCPSFSYALSLFDDRLGQYVNNGLVEVNLVGY